jgi:hypothetical protein
MTKPTAKNRDWLQVAGFMISALAFLVSAFAVYRSNQDSYLSHKANLAPVTWAISDNRSQLQFHIMNSGSTPAHLIKAYGQIFDGDKTITSPTLLNDMEIMPSMPDKFVPILSWNLDPTELVPRKNVLQLILEYRDYKEHRESVSKFEVVQDPNGNGIHLQLIGETLY